MFDRVESFHRKCAVFLFSKLFDYNPQILWVCDVMSKQGTSQKQVDDYFVSGTPKKRGRLQSSPEIELYPGEKIQDSATMEYR